MSGKGFIFLVCFFLPAAFSHAQLDKGLVAAYYFSGNANDSHAAINGNVYGATLTTDRFGNKYAAYSFDGVNDFISLGSNKDLRQQTMSISFWMKIYDFNSRLLNYPAIPLLTTRAGPFVHGYEAISVGVFRSNHKINGANTSAAQRQITCLSKNTVAIDRWYHIVYMFDRDTACLYVDGDLQERIYKGFVSEYALNDSVMLGHVNNHTPDTSGFHAYAWLNGCLDDFKFYNRLLSDSEVKELFFEPDPKVDGEPDQASVSLTYLMKLYWFLPVLMVAVIFLVVIIIRWRINYFRRKEKERNELQQKFAQMEMKALRSQMNPHFIFNAINSIQHYVLTNEKELANKYLVKFSQLMRNILDLSKQELISLKDELETVKLYLDIESLRFNNAFSFSVTISEEVSAADIRLPPLIIQPFVENAIWHGLLLKEGNKKLEITVFKKENNVIIKIDDNGIGREVSQKFNNKELKRRSFGMDITQDRLSVLDKVFGILISFDVFDKKNERGESLGTTVFINVKL